MPDDASPPVVFRNRLEGQPDHPVFYSADDIDRIIAAVGKLPSKLIRQGDAHKAQAGIGVFVDEDAPLVDRRMELWELLEETAHAFVYLKRLDRGQKRWLEAPEEYQKISRLCKKLNSLRLSSTRDAGAFLIIDLVYLS
jgi:hypothetical protein